jgi:putative acetyltransferase
LNTNERHNCKKPYTFFDMYKLDVPQKTEYSILLDIWESSVRATHHFLQKEDIEVLKKIIREKGVFNHVSLTCARDINNNILGFMGVSKDSIEMLFIDSRSIGREIGKILLLHAIKDLNITKVDVNEQNEQALRFYEHFGFKITSRSELDGTGKPYPILHMQLQ